MKKNRAVHRPFVRVKEVAVKYWYSIALLSIVIHTNTYLVKVIDGPLVDVIVVCPIADDFGDRPASLFHVETVR